MKKFTWMFTAVALAFMTFSCGKEAKEMKIVEQYLRHMISYVQSPAYEMDMEGGDAMSAPYVLDKEGQKYLKSVAVGVTEFTALYEKYRADHRLSLLIAEYEEKSAEATKRCSEKTLKALMSDSK